MNDRFKFRCYSPTQETFAEVEKIDFEKSIVFDVCGEGYKLNEIILMQCTGLKDKNGTPIYEGDYVKNYDNRIYKVIWQEDAACFLVENIKTGCKQGIYSLISLSNDLEIVGNCYENKELLEGLNE